MIVIAFCLLVLSPVASNGGETSEIARQTLLNGMELIRELQKGGYVIFVRHSLTDLNQEDTDLKNLKNCATQRNLSEAGRILAKSVGESVKRLNIPVSQVLSSPYCRCMDTANLVFGRAAPSNSLYYALGATKEERDKLTTDLRIMLATPPPPGSNVAIVSHTANLKEATGLWPDPEGVAVVFKPDPENRFHYVGTILPESWAGYR